jgi:hypothetical protein
MTFYFKWVSCPSEVSCPAPEAPVLGPRAFPDIAEVMSLLAPNADIAIDESLTQAADSVSWQDYEMSVLFE